MREKLGFAGNLGPSVSPFLQAFDIAQKIEGAMLSAGQVFDKAHHQTVFAAGLDDDRRDLCLSEFLKGL